MIVEDVEIEESPTCSTVLTFVPIEECDFWRRVATVSWIFTFAAILSLSVQAYYR